jgi:sec-independent protein translocase protein TatB
MSVGWLEIPGWGEPVRAFISWQETAAIFVVILIIFGPKSIPEVARMLAKFMQQFREAAAELQRNLYIDDVKEIQRELRDSWKTKPERMRTVKPGAEHGTAPDAPDPEEAAAENAVEEDAAAPDAYAESSPEPEPESTPDEKPDRPDEPKEETPPEEEEDRKPS